MIMAKVPMPPHSTLLNLSVTPALVSEPLEPARATGRVDTCSTGLATRSPDFTGLKFAISYRWLSGKAAELAGCQPPKCD